MAFLPEVFSALLTLSFLAHQPSYNSPAKSNSDTNTEDIYCYSTDNSKPQRKHYALETPHPPDYTEMFEIPDCQPAKIWIVTRHGTRYPSSGSLKKLAQNIPDVNIMSMSIIIGYLKCYKYCCLSIGFRKSIKK